MPRTKRKALSRKVRFEVFKRDSFTCQYCGRSAPAVILQIDHMKPVSKGGTDELMNLISSCDKCNQGKSDRLLSDDSMVKKRQRQAELLNERRLQMEMLFQWHQELKGLEEEQIEQLSEYWSTSVDGFLVNESGKQALAKLLKKYGIKKLLEAMDTSTKYVKLNKRGTVISKSADEAFSKIGAILRVEERSEQKPYLRQLYYIRGILRKRVYVNERYVMQLLENAVLAEVTADWIEGQAKSCSSWTSFREAVETATVEVGEQDEQETKVELDSETENRINLVSLLTDLCEDYGFEEDQAELLADGLNVLCGDFDNYLKGDNYSPEDPEGVAWLAVQYFDDRVPCAKHFSRNGDKCDLKKLNQYFSQNRETDIPFLLYSKYRIDRVVLPSRYIYECFVSALQRVSDGPDTAFDLLHDVHYDEYASESLLAAATEGVLRDGFERCGVEVTSSDLRRLKTYFKREDLIDILETWMSKYDDDGELLASFDPVKNYTWEGFLSDLGVNVGPDPLTLRAPENVEDYLDLFREKRVPFQGFFFEDSGILRCHFFHEWEQFEEAVRG